ncbi:hypothetical protein Btru_000098 [Bulinus truncatus]|nr:hypothetical protein Btru_000098 [Bulinus truncatus]
MDVRITVTQRCTFSNNFLSSVVLPEIVSTPILSLARAGTEWKHLKLAFKFPIENVLSVHSIVVLGSEQCLLSCELINTNQDAIHYYNYDAKTKRIKQHPYDVDKGRYLIAQTSNGEIVASYSNKAGKEHFVKYNDGNFLDYRGLNSYIKFTDISQVDYPAFGIATTSDDKILLCYQVAEKKILAVVGVVDMEVGGWHRKAVVGSIFASSSFHEDQRDLMSSVFKPYGLCYDSYGFIIVTDPDKEFLVVPLVSRLLHSQLHNGQPLVVNTPEEPYFTNPLS